MKETGHGFRHVNFAQPRHFPDQQQWCHAAAIVGATICCSSAPRRQYGEPPRSLAVLRASDMRLLDEPDIFVPRPHALAVDTVSGRVYVSSHGRAAARPGEAHPGAGHDMEGPRANGTLVVIDAATGTIRNVIEVGPYAAALGLAVVH